MVLAHKDDISSPERLAYLIENHQITCAHFVPGMLDVFIGALSEGRFGISDLQSLRRVITSGEALAADTVLSWYKKMDIPIYNLYGPTEASIEVSHYKTSRYDTKIPIGRPIWNTQLYIISEARQLQPMGVTGEICIGGVGLARGYINNAALTDEKFVINPFKEGGRMYKTGDLGRWLPDGNIEFIGRKDNQVKVRGYRIELGEIESALQGHEGVESAIVTARCDQYGEKELVAYVVSRPAAGTLAHSAGRLVHRASASRNCCAPPVSSAARAARLVTTTSPAATRVAATTTGCGSPRALGCRRARACAGARTRRA